MYYWHIELWDGTIIKVRPIESTIKAIQAQMSKGDGSIVTETQTIVVKNIKDFRLSDEFYQDQKLLEDSRQAFGIKSQQKLTPDGDMIATWVKKGVPHRKYESFYRHNYAYRFIGEDSVLVYIGFRVPVHLIDYDKVQDMTDDELIKLNLQNSSVD